MAQNLVKTSKVEFLDSQGSVVKTMYLSGGLITIDGTAIALGASTVSSVFGRTGAVAAQAGDYDYSQVTEAQREVSLVVYPTGIDDHDILQEAVDTVTDLGGGEIWLVGGAYDFGDEVVWPNNASNVVVRGVGSATIIESSLTGNTYPFNLGYNPGLALDKAISATTKGDTTVTCSTPSQASAYTVGMPVLIEGLDADGFNRQFPNEVLTAGNSGTGVIGLKNRVQISLTSATITGWEYGMNNGVRDLSVVHVAGASHVVRFDYQWNSILHNLNLNGANYSAAYSLHITNSVFPTITSIQNINYNVIETEGMTTAAKGMEISNCYGLTMRDVLLENNGEATINAGALALTNIENAVFDNVRVISANYNGIALSSASSSVDVTFVNCRIQNCTQKGFVQNGSTKGITFVNTNFNANSQSDIELTGVSDWVFVACSFTDNSDSGSDETIILANCENIDFTACVVKNCRSGVAITSGTTNVTFNDCRFLGLANIGVYVGASSDGIAINGCRFLDNKWGVLSGDNNTGVTINASRFQGNTTAAIIQGAGDTDWILTSNYADGETVTLGGTGNEVANNIGF